MSDLSEQIKLLEHSAFTVETYEKRNLLDSAEEALNRVSSDTDIHRRIRAGISTVRDAAKIATKLLRTPDL